KAAVAPLVELVEHSKSALGRMHALHALDGLGALKESEVLTAMNDVDAVVRQHAVLLSEKLFPKGDPSPKLAAKFEQLAADPDILVRYQLAFTLGEIKGPSKISPLAKIAKRDLASSWTQAAILSSLAEGAGELFVLLSTNKDVGTSSPGQEFL